MPNLTLLDMVNNTMRRAGLIDSVDEVLADLTEDALQVDIDMMIDAINDVIREMHSIADLLPWQTSIGTITLADGTKEYAGPTNFMAMSSSRLQRLDEGMFISPYKGGYEQMFHDQTDPSQYTGQPTEWALNPVTDTIRLNATPGASEAGHVYSFLYSAEIYMSTAAQEFPFNDAVTHALQPAIVEAYRQMSDGDEEYSPITKVRSLSQAIKRLTHAPDRERYA